MKYLFSLATVLCLASFASAQALHGYPGKAAYASPAEWPLISAQGHWAPANTNTTCMPVVSADPSGCLPGVDPTIGHTHVECWVPIYAEITSLAPFDLSCRIQLFHLAGQVTAIRGYQVDSLTLGPGVVWPLTGDPMAVKVFPFTLHLNPAMSQVSEENNSAHVPVHGWWEVDISAVTQFDNGSSTSVELMVPMFSAIDVSAEIPTWASGFRLAAITTAHPTNERGNFGLNTSDFINVYLPILTPLASAQTILGSSYVYGNSGDFGQMGTFKELLDPDFHNGIPGTVVRTTTTNGGTPNEPILFDPVAMGAGVHKVAVMWDQKTGAGNAFFDANEEVSSLLVVNVTVGDGVPPPPPPPPPPTWTTISATIQRLGDSVRLCATDGACLVLGTLVH